MITARLLLATIKRLGRILELSRKRRIEGILGISISRIAMNENLSAGIDFHGRSSLQSSSGGV